MDKHPHSTALELLYVIVNNSVGSKILRFAKTQGITGGTILLGVGTVRSRLLDFLEMGDIRKEIVMMLAEKHIADRAAAALYQEFRLDKPNHGIAFSVPVRSIHGTQDYINETKPMRREDSKMYHAIYVIVPKGRAGDAIDAATDAGSKGGTIINARGSGVHETTKLLSMDVEPEKEIVLILSQESATKAIVDAINSALEIDKPGNGVIFVQEVSQALGLY